MKNKLITTINYLGGYPISLIAKKDSDAEKTLKVLLSNVTNDVLIPYDEWKKEVVVQNLGVFDHDFSYIVYALFILYRGEAFYILGSETEDSYDLDEVKLVPKDSPAHIELLTLSSTYQTYLLHKKNLQKLIKDI